MIIVIAIIALVLAIGVPAFNAMTIQQRMSKTRQLLDGALVRTQIIGVSDQTLTAIRLCPAEWHLDKDAALGSLAGRQMLTTYAYRFTYAANPSNPTQVKFAERFERVEEGPTQLLPPDTWVAPSEAFDLTRRMASDSGGGLLGDVVLKGRIGDFEFDASKHLNNFLEADDFLIVFDPETGVQPSARGDQRSCWPLVGYDPRTTSSTAQQETNGVNNDRFKRYNFTGAVIYRREPFAALEKSLDGSALIEARRDVLKRLGQTYYVSRTGGGLVAGAGEPAQ